MKSSIVCLFLFMALLCTHKTDAQSENIPSTKKFSWGATYAFQIGTNLSEQFHFAGCNFGTDTWGIEGGLLAGHNKHSRYYIDDRNFYDPGPSKGLYLILNYAFGNRNSWCRPYVNLQSSYFISDATGSYNYGDPCIPLPGYRIEYNIQSLCFHTALGWQFRISERFYLTNEVMLRLLNSTKTLNTIKYDGIADSYTTSSTNTGFFNQNFHQLPLYSLKFGLRYHFR